MAIKIFSSVPNRNVTLPDLSKPVLPFDDRNLGQIVKFVPVKDTNQLGISWILPNQHKEYNSQPLAYFSHLFGYEGENSLLSYLKK